MATDAMGLHLHFVYGFDTLAHPGPVYVAAACILAGTALSYKAPYR